MSIYITLLKIQKSSHLIPHQTPQGAVPLRGDPSSNTGGPNFARLGDDDVARQIFLAVVVENELRQQGGLAAACGSSDDHDRVVFYERNQLGGNTETH